MIIFSSTPNGLYGQTIIGPYKFKHLTINDGLSQNQINDIAQDSSDFIWIASKNGLNKFDGRHLSNYYNIPFDSTSLSDNYVKNLFVDSKGRLWVGTQSGLDLYDAQNDHFKRIKKLYKRKLVDREVEDIVEDANGNIWVSFTTNGLVCITINQDQLSIIFEPIAYLTKHPIITMFADGNDLYLGSKDALSIFDHNTKELIHKKTTALIKSQITYTEVLPIGSIAKAKGEDYLWMGTKNGLIRYHKPTGTGELFVDDLDKLNNSFNWDGCYDDQLLDLEKNLIWMSGGYGFAVFNLAQEEFVHYPFDTKHASHENSGFINCIQYCKDGSIWFGTNGYGIDIYSSQLNKFNHFNIQQAESFEYQDFSLRSIFQSSDSTIWMASYVLYSFDPKSNVIKSYNTPKKDAVDFGSTLTFSFNEDTLGNLWMGTWDGLYKYNLGTKYFKHYSSQKGETGTLPESIVYGTFIDAKQNVWALTNSYLCKLDQETSQFDCEMLEDQTLDLANLYAKIIEDDEGYFWINTNYGLLKYDPHTKSKKWFRHDSNNPNSVSIDKIKTIKKDDLNSNIIWIGTSGGGLNRLDIESNTFTHYTVADGLPDNVIYGILQDDLGHLWMSTNKGLSQFDVQKNMFTNYTIEHGLQSNEFNSGAYYKSPNGQLFFGGLNGFNSFFPEDISTKQYTPKTIINRFRLLDPKVNPDGSYLKTQDLNNQSHELALDHDQNVFQIDYSAMEFGFSPDIYYEYKLDGWDQDYISSKQSQAIYSNVPYGDYVFKVRARHDQNVKEFNEASLKINIQPPFWLSKWAIVFYVISSMALLYLIWSEVMSRRKLRKELELEHLKSEQLKELDEFKTRFFSNISHELRTPLTLILSPLDDIIEKTENARNVESLQLIQTNAERLLQLVNQLLDLSKIQNQKYVLNITEQPLQMFVEKIVNGFKPLAQEKGISLNLKINLGQRLYSFDKDVMIKILSNLISNALKFSQSEGFVKVEVSSKNKLNYHELIIDVKDNGLGIAEQDLPHIFNRFYRAKDHNNQNISVSGTGIGLALTKELIEKCQGNISVNSHKSHGTEFQVILPLMIEPSNSSGVVNFKTDHEEKLKTKSENGSRLKEELNNPLILIVDDNQDILDLIKNTLGSDYQYVEANDGLEGEKKAISMVPDLIISDVMMPIKDGYELCSTIKSDFTTSHIPVILLTAKSSLESKIDGLELGADVYLTKPFNSKELRLRVRNLLLHRQTIQRKFGEQKSWNSIWTELGSTDHDFVNKLNTFLDKNLSTTELSLDDMSKEMNLSSRQLRRKLHALTNQSPKQYLRSYRLKFSMSLLKIAHQDIREVAYQTGFSSPAYFSKCFKDEFGKTPKEYS